MPYLKAKPINGVPTLGNNVPTITLPMLLDHLNRHIIVHCPPITNRAFGALAPVFNGELKNDAIPSELAPANVLMVCENTSDLEILLQQPASFALLLQNDPAPLPFTEEPLSDLAERVLVIRSGKSYGAFIFDLQSFFQRIFAWEKELDHIADHGGNLTSMLDASHDVIRNFIFISSSDFNIIARTSKVEPPDEMHREMIETGLVPASSVTMKEAHLEEASSYLGKAGEGGSTVDRYAIPLFEKHTYVGSVSMACSEQPLTEGLKHTFFIMIRHMAKPLKEAWLTKDNEKKPHYLFLQKLLNHETVTIKYVEEQMRFLNIDSKARYKLVVIEGFRAMPADKQARIIQSIPSFKSGRTLHLTYEDDLIILLFNTNPLRTLSHAAVGEECHNLFYQPLSVITGQSSPFNDICDLDLAYRQAKLALKLREPNDREQFALSSESDKGSYLFDDVFLYHLLEQARKDNRFYSFCFSTSVVQVIYEDDKNNGTNNLALLWFYLTSWGNATYTAKQLNMHRNTILYHVEKIEKRFDIDIKNKTVRDRLILDYKALFLSLSSKSIESIFGNSNPEEGMDG